MRSVGSRSIKKFLIQNIHSKGIAAIAGTYITVPCAAVISIGLTKYNRTKCQTLEA